MAGESKACCGRFSTWTPTLVREASRSARPLAYTLTPDRPPERHLILVNRDIISLKLLLVLCEQKTRTNSNDNKQHNKEQKQQEHQQEQTRQPNQTKQDDQTKTREQEHKPTDRETNIEAGRKHEKPGADQSSHATRHQQTYERAKVLVKWRTVP